jgi:hypothetical protein
MQRSLFGDLALRFANHWQSSDARHSRNDLGARKRPTQELTGQGRVLDTGAGRVSLRQPRRAARLGPCRGPSRPCSKIVRPNLAQITSQPRPASIYANTSRTAGSSSTTRQLAEVYQWLRRLAQLFTWQLVRCQSQAHRQQAARRIFKTDIKVVVGPGRPSIEPVTAAISADHTRRCFRI